MSILTPSWETMKAVPLIAAGWDTGPMRCPAHVARARHVADVGHAFGEGAKIGGMDTEIGVQSCMAGAIGQEVVWAGPRQLPIYCDSGWGMIARTQHRTRTRKCFARELLNNDWCKGWT